MGGQRFREMMQHELYHPHPESGATVFFHQPPPTSIRHLYLEQCNTHMGLNYQSMCYFTKLHMNK